MSFNIEDLFGSIDVIVAQRLADLSYDKTIIATITDDSDKVHGRYIVSDGTIKFDAYVNDMNYKTGDQVRVTIMNGDWSQKKFIVGLYDENIVDNKLVYVPPLSNVFQTDYAKESVIDSFILFANEYPLTSEMTASERKEILERKRIKQIWKKNIPEGSSEYILQANGIYNVITLSGDFKTNLGAVAKGNYGLRLDLYGEFEEGTSKFITFDCNEMIGNPYSFVIDSHQEKQVSIATAGIVTEISLSIYQGVSYDDNGIGIEDSFIDKNGNLIEQLPIEFKNLTIGFGSNLVDIEDNKLQIYTLNSTVYKYNGGNGDETNNKQMGLVWYNKTDSNEYVGFSDGVYDPTYDEMEYLRESYADSRLVKNIDKTTIADDELSLTLAANIEESEPLMTAAYEALTTKLSSVLQALGRQIPGTSFMDKLNPLIGAWIDENGDAQSAILVQARDKAERSTQDWVSLYRDVLQYGYNVQNGIEAIWNENWESVNHYSEFDTAVRNGLLAVANFFTYMEENTRSNKAMSGYRGIYNSYWVKADREIKAIELILSQIITSSAVYDSTTIDDFTWLIGYKNKTKEDLPSYIKDNLDEYHNKYCIYWYRYNEGYSLAYNSEEGADNTEYQFGRFLGDNWERVQVDNYGNKIFNFGLPMTAGNISDGVQYWPKSPATEQLLNRKMNPKTESERYQAILFYNHKMYRSNVLLFTNVEADQIPIEFAVDAADTLRVEHSTYSQDHYQIYSSANDLVNIADESRIRQLKCYYEGVLAGDEALAGADLYWYIPVNSTMLTYDKNYLIKQGFTTDADERTSLSKDGYIYFYKKVGFDVNKIESTDSAGNPILDAAGNKVFENEIIIHEADKYFFYKVKPYYEASAQNNTILVEAHLENGDKTKITTGELPLTFSSFGTNGTKYTLSIVPNTTQIAVLPQDEENPNPPLTLTLSLRNADGDLIEMSSDIINLPEDGVTEDILTYDLNIGWWAKDDEVSEGVLLENIIDSKSKLVSINNGYDTDNKYIGIIKAVISFDEELTDGKNRTIQLDTMYPIPFSSNLNYYISGPTMIVYNNQGTVSRLSEEPYKLFEHTLDGDQEISDCTWTIEYYDNSGKSIETYDNDKKDAILAYMPKLNKDNTLMAAPLYCAFDDGSFIIPVAVCRNASNDVVWSQPIIITQNDYASSTLNDWNGKFEINEANGTILSTMIGAGKKNANNTFDGILMGDIEAGANFDTDNASGLGLYGFNDGAQSFHFGIDGKAFLGKAGRGRIIFDGNDGSISSASYQQNRIPIRDEEGKIIGYTDQSTAGMMIDLDDGFIDMHGTVIEETNYVPKINEVTEEEWLALPDEEKEHDTYQEYLDSIEAEETKVHKQSRVRIDVKDPYFTIHSAQQASENTYIIYVGEEEYYLQSDKYVASKFDTSSEDLTYAEDNEAADGKGMKIDLRNGSINSYKFTLTSKNVFLDAGDGAETYLSIRDNNGKVLLYLSDDKQFIKSADYIPQNKAKNYPGSGMRLDLHEGAIHAYDFKLESGTTSEYNHTITIDSSGLPYLRIRDESDNVLLSLQKSTENYDEEFYLQTSDYSKASENGMKIDLVAGTIEAYDGFKLTAVGPGNIGSITIDAGASSDSYPLKIGNNFMVSWGGALTASGATVTGTINATGGSFSGNISATGTITGGTISGATIIGGNISIVNDVFTVNGDGHLTCNSATIGGWEVSSTGLSNGAIGFNPTGITGTYWSTDEDGKTTLTDLTILNKLTTSGVCQVYLDGYVGIGTQPDSSYNLKTAKDIYLGGTIYVGGTSTYLQNYSNGLWVYGHLVSFESQKVQFGANGSNTEVYLCDPEKTYIRENGAYYNLPSYIKKYNKSLLNLTIGDDSETGGIVGEASKVSNILKFTVNNKELLTYDGSEEKTLDFGSLAFQDSITASLVNFSNTTVTAAPSSGAGVYKVTITDPVTIPTYSSQTVYLYTTTQPSGGYFQTSETTNSNSIPSGAYWTKITRNIVTNTSSTSNKTFTGYVQVSVSAS